MEEVEGEEDLRVNPCDYEGCRNDDAYLRCSGCKCYYFCSKECQKKHWKSHKVDSNYFY